MSKPMVGVPVTVVASLMVTVTVTTSPVLSVLFAAPVALLMATELTVGAVVSLLPVLLLVLLPPPPPAAAARPRTPTAIQSGEIDETPAPAPAVAGVAPGSGAAAEVAGATIGGTAQAAAGAAIGAGADTLATGFGKSAIANCSV